MDQNDIFCKFIPMQYLFMKKKMPFTGEGNLIDELTFEPLSKENWAEFVALFGERGACGNCWCMHFRLKKEEFAEGKENDGNKEKMKELVWSNLSTGILCFYEGQAIGWCAFAPREAYLKLENSRVHKRIDNEPVWSITCFFIGKQFRRMGISVALLKGLINIARQQQIKVIEAYPTIPTQETLPDAFAWIGLYRTFEEAGFKIVDQTSKNRPMMRYYVENG